MACRNAPSRARPRLRLVAQTPRASCRRLSRLRLPRRRSSVTRRKFKFRPQFRPPFRLRRDPSPAHRPPACPHPTSALPSRPTPPRQPKFLPPVRPPERPQLKFSPFFRPEDPRQLKFSPLSRSEDPCQPKFSPPFRPEDPRQPKFSPPSRPANRRQLRFSGRFTLEMAVLDHQPSPTSLQEAASAGGPVLGCLKGASPQPPHELSTTGLPRLHLRASRSPSKLRPGTYSG